MEILLLIVPQNDSGTRHLRRTGSTVGDHGQTHHLRVVDQGEIIFNRQRHFCAAFELKSKLREIHGLGAGSIKTGTQPRLSLNVLRPGKVPQLLHKLLGHQIINRAFHESEGGSRVHDGAAVTVRAGVQKAKRNLNFLAADNDLTEAEIVIFQKGGVAGRRVGVKRRVAEAVGFGVAGGAYV